MPGTEAKDQICISYHITISHLTAYCIIAAWPQALGLRVAIAEPLLASSLPPGSSPSLVLPGPPFLFFHQILIIHEFLGVALLLFSVVNLILSLLAICHGRNTCSVQDLEMDLSIKTLYNQ